MTIKEFTRAAVVSGALTLAGAGAAFADSASIEETGPDSTNIIKISSSQRWDVDNTNNVTVNNNNTQNASTGNASVNRNTTGGDASSGNASNNNTTTTTIEISNDSSVGGGGSGSGGGQGSGGGAGSGSGAGGQDGSSGGVGGSGSGGNLALGGVGGGVSTLPEVGCEVICDVSALRAGYNDNIASQAAERAKGVSAGLLALAAILSLAGAGGSALFASRKTQL